MAINMDNNQCDICEDQAKCAMVNKDSSLRYCCLKPDHINEVWNRVQETKTK